MVYKIWKAYILSIPNSDRRKNVENLKVILEAHGIITEILDGFHYHQIDVIDLLYKQGITYDCPDKSLSLSQIGCFLSHRQAWERISKESNQEVLSIIIEDDMTILNPQDFNIDYLLEEINKQDTFHGIILWKHPEQIKNNPIYKTKNLLEFYYQWGLCAYSITHELAIKLLTSIKKIHIPVDQILFGEIFPTISSGMFMSTREHFENLGRLSSYDNVEKKFKSMIWS